MGKITIAGKEYNYHPHIDEISMERLKQRMLMNKTFSNIFKKNLTDGFMKSMREIVNPNIRHEENTIWNVMGLSGCQPKNSKVLMYDGSWKNIQDIKIGDMVISYDKNMTSRPEIVLRTTKWLCGEHYHIHQKNGNQKKLYSCSYNHVIPFIRTISLVNIYELPARTFYELGRSMLKHNLMGISCLPIKNFLQEGHYFEPIILKRTNKKQYVHGFTLSGETGYYITDNYMLTHNSGKSKAVVSLAKQITPATFSYKNIVFYDQEVLDFAKDMPRDSFIIRDETVDSFGAGSARIMSDLSALSETARKYGVNLVFLSASEKEISVAKWNLFTVDIDYENRITRLGLQDPFTKSFLGAVYVKVLPDDDEDWVRYNINKDKFIEDIREGKKTGSKGDYKQMARDILSRIDIDVFCKKKERVAFIRTEFPNMTNSEIDIISTFVEVMIKSGVDCIGQENQTEARE